MNIQNALKMFLVVGMVGLFGCGGGGGGTPTTTTTTTPTPPTVAKTTTTISGKVEFPSLSSLVAKRVGSMVPDQYVSIQAYTLEGVAVGTPVTPSYENTVPGSAADFTMRIYSYELTEIPIGKDYVIKATRRENGNTQELKKLIEKSDVVENMPTQTLNSVSTAAVVVASQKLTDAMAITSNNGSAVKIFLGDTLPPEMKDSVSKLSDAIVTDVDPKLLETTILSAKTNSLATAGGFVTYLSSLTEAEKKAFVDLVNMLNIVVTAVANNADPAKILASEPVPLSTAVDVPQLKLFSVDSGGVVTQELTAKTILTSQVVQETVTSAVVTYVPPRVKLEFSTNATSLYGVTFEVTIPAAAKVRADATGKLDMALITVPAGTYVDAQYNATTGIVKIILASGSAPLPAKFITLNFDRTAGTTLGPTDFPHSIIDTSDGSGNVLSTVYVITKTATTIGS